MTQFITQAFKWDNFEMVFDKKKSLDREGFQHSKTDKKQMNCYQKDSVSKTLFNY